MQLAPHHRFVLAWLILGTLAAAVCSLIWSAAHLRGEVIPVGNDSFYHARRILDTAADPSSFYEFDPKIHAPEGSLLVWPWGYDYAMGWIVRIGGTLGLAAEPIRILVWLPVAAVFISIGLIMLIARRLALPLLFCSLAALCVALSPLTQYLHGVGFVDHHFAEYMLVLATVFCGLCWFEGPASQRAAFGLGIVLGVAPAVHNALFILQIPVVLTLFLFWLQQRQLPNHTTAVFGATLLVATAAILAPSLPVREGRFDFYLLSWFHLYIACSTLLLCIFFARYRRTAASGGALIAGGLLLLLPLAYQIVLARSFLTGQILRLGDIGEMQSPLQMAARSGVLDVSNRYSFLLWLLPATCAFCLYQGWRDRTSARLFYWVSSVLGISLLAMQFRMHYFGSFALCIPWLVAVQQFIERAPQRRKLLSLGTALVLLLLLAPPLRGQLWGPMLPANDPSFLNIRESLGVLRQACREDPGVVLADNDIGHYIRYYTECSVIADNFLLTAQHEEKIREMERLFALSAAELPTRAPFVKYVMMRPSVFKVTERGVTYRPYSEGSNQLFADLLLKPHANSPVRPPPAYALLYETNIVAANVEVPYLALYKIHVGTDSSSTRRP